MDGSKARVQAIPNQGHKTNVLNEGAKTLRSPSPRAKIRPN